MKKNYRLKQRFNNGPLKWWSVQRSYEPFGWLWFTLPDLFLDYIYYDKAKARLEQYQCDDAVAKARKTFKPIILTPPLPDKEPS